MISRKVASVWSTSLVIQVACEGNWIECGNAISTAGTAILGDPEVLFYSARHLARINQIERAISALSKAIDRGFLCASVLSRDPWFEPLRSCSGYIEVLQKAECRRTESHASFLAAGGEQVISIA